MATEPPAELLDLYRRVQTLDTNALTHEACYVDPRAFFSGPAAPSPLLRRSDLKNAAWQESYGSVQEAFFDFAGRCMYCENPERHPHSVQASGVLEVEGFPGLYIYPKLLSNGLVHKGLIDTLLHDQLADLGTTTNLHEKYHVTYPASTESNRDAHTSFIDPVASQLIMQPRPEGSDDWTASPLTARGFVDKLRQFTFGDASANGSRASMWPKIRALVEDILPVRAHSATAYVSSHQDPLELRRCEGEAGTWLDISLGCDGVFVVGLEVSGSEEEVGRDSENQGVNDDSWRDLIADSDSEGDEKAPARQDQSSTNSDRDTTSTPKSATRLAAIHLRSTDALLFTGPSRQAWYGVAKVIPGSCLTFEQEWPCWPGTVDGRGMEDWKGCMTGRRIDLRVR